MERDRGSSAGVADAVDGGRLDGERRTRLVALGDRPNPLRIGPLRVARGEGGLVFGFSPSYPLSIDTAFAGPRITSPPD